MIDTTTHIVSGSKPLQDRFLHEQWYLAKECWVGTHKKTIRHSIFQTDHTKVGKYYIPGSNKFGFIQNLNVGESPLSNRILKNSFPLQFLFELFTKHTL